MVEQSVGHERQMQTGLQSALTALPGTPTAGPPAGGQQPRRHRRARRHRNRPAVRPGRVGQLRAGGARGTSLHAGVGDHRRHGRRPGRRVGTGRHARLHRRPRAGRAAAAAAATALATAGVPIDRPHRRLFALVRPELGGGRIPADRKDLKQEWRLLRLLLRPADARPAASNGGVDGPATRSLPRRQRRPVPTEAHEAPVKRPDARPAAPRRSTRRSPPRCKKAFGKGGVKRYLAVRGLYATRRRPLATPRSG